MAFDEHFIRQQICDIGRRVWDRGMIAANDGNLTVKINENEILCTPTGVSKGFMTPDMICKVDLGGNVLKSDGIYRPSSEIKVHLKVYKRRPDVNAVVHAHPKYATAYAIVGRPLTKQIIPEATLSFGEVPVAKYALPSSAELADSIEPFLDTHDVVLLQNHGALCWGEDLIAAYFKMESLEFYAELCFITEVLGGAKELPNSEVEQLLDLRRRIGMSGRHSLLHGKKR
jgi:L-fuculose-phosphate aldolase